MYADNVVLGYFDTLFRTGLAAARDCEQLVHHHLEIPGGAGVLVINLLHGVALYGFVVHRKEPFGKFDVYRFVQRLEVDNLCALIKGSGSGMEHLADGVLLAAAEDEVCMVAVLD